MTRNEYIASVAAITCPMETCPSIESGVSLACNIAAALEHRGVAPWADPPAPALTDTAAKVVEAAESVIGSFGDTWCSPAFQGLANAVRAHLAAKGGAS